MDLGDKELELLIRIEIFMVTQVVQEGKAPMKVLSRKYLLFFPDQPHMERAYLDAGNVIS